MFEKFTDRGRRIMHLANCEAKRLNHEFIDTYHVLFGLLEEGNGVAANVLKNMGLTIQRLRDSGSIYLPAGPEMVTMGMMPRTPRVKAAIDRAANEASQLGHAFIGTEHLLLGLLDDDAKSSVAVAVLEYNAIPPTRVRAEVLALLDQPARIPSVASEPMSLRDWFAGNAVRHIAGLMPKTSKQREPQAIAVAAYEIADALMEARKLKT